jgi:hypothetical protein
MPCSGLTFPVPHLGPPMAPRSTASAALAASRALAVRGSPVASIEAWNYQIGQTKKYLAGTYTAEKVFLEVKLAHTGSACFDHFKDLRVSIKFW